MQELRPPGLVLSLIADAASFVAEKIDDRFCLQRPRFDGCEPTRQCRSNCDTVSDTSEELAPDGELRSIPKDAIELNRDLGFRMRARYPQFSENMDTHVNHRWHLNHGCSTSHQLSLTIDASFFPTSFRQRNLVLAGSAVACQVPTAHRVWFRLKQQLLSEFGVFGMSLPNGLESNSSMLHRAHPDLPEICATRLAFSHHRMFYPSTGRAHSSHDE